ncbi:peptidoglycan DD-metalloendopeptidase family protein [Thalassococcus sp. CAU 1522]|uniref:Peptidoglycan DD-metalloendopeptidase family protein n=1 Tax=Thalassococcus arenae TaxID=2851652 RepID=A0ABS6N9L6_9RHOB|nr:peptidoglycan DD-metalloendopeptidase family protein [Thalassococcus arenae]MBV2360704.1 peptidoglycan DD-metalloendopeptidase family protein [Thalassococcus arenae]
MATPRPFPILAMFGLSVSLSACADFDLDVRDRIGGPFSTAQAAREATTRRPVPDDRGVLSYPSYQVAIARRGDTLADVAARVGLPADEVARFNGIQPGDTLNRGEIVALPRRVAEPSPATGATTTGPILPPAVDVTTLANDAIERAPATPAATSPQTGIEPVRHKVERGETAFTIARLYGVTPRALADWNGLDRDYTLREGQFLLIPPKAEITAAAAPAAVPAPGSGSTTPQPPSASTPLPSETPPAASVQTATAAAPKPPVADIGQSAARPEAQMTMPVSGRIIRDYAPGRSEGIDIGAPAGTPVVAAASGSVAAVTRNDENVLIVVIRHPGDLLTVYTHLDDLTVKKGDAVSRGQTIGKVRAGDPSFLHFEIRKGFDSVDPMGYVS